MDRLEAAAEAVREADNALAAHAGRRHRGCAVCLDVGVLLLVAQEALGEATKISSPSLTPRPARRIRF